MINFASAWITQGEGSEKAPLDMFSAVFDAFVNVLAIFSMKVYVVDLQNRSALTKISSLMGKLSGL